MNALYVTNVQSNAEYLFYLTNRTHDLESKSKTALSLNFHYPTNPTELELRTTSAVPKVEVSSQWAPVYHKALNREKQITTFFMQTVFQLLSDIMQKVCVGEGTDITTELESCRSLAEALVKKTEYLRYEVRILCSLWPLNENGRIWMRYRQLKI